MHEWRHSRHSRLQGGSSLFAVSPVAQATMFGVAPAAPAATWGDAAVDLSWSGPGLHQVLVGANEQPASDILSVTTHQVGGLLNGIGTEVRVRAYARGAFGPASAPAGGTPTNSTGYSQMDADAGWRNAGGGIQSINTAANRSWQGDAGIFRQSVGFYNENGQDYDTPTLQLPSPARRLRLRIVDVATPDSPISIWIRSQTQWYGDQWQVYWDPSTNFISLGEITGGTYTYVTGASGPSRSQAQAHTLEVRDTGSIISVYVNGSMLLSHPTTSKASNQYCGFQIGPGSSGRVRWLSVDIVAAATIHEVSSRGLGLGLSSANRLAALLVSGQGQGNAVGRGAVSAVRVQPGRGVAMGFGTGNAVRLLLQAARGYAQGVSVAPRLRLALQTARGLSQTTSRGETFRIGPITARGHSHAFAAVAALRIGLAVARGFSHGLGGTNAVLLASRQARGVSTTLGRSTSVRLVIQSARGYGVGFGRSQTTSIKLQSARGYSLTLSQAAVDLVSDLSVSAIGYSVGLGRANRVGIGVQAARGQSASASTTQRSLVAEVAAGGQSGVLALSPAIRVVLQSARGFSYSLGLTAVLRVSEISLSGFSGALGLGQSTRIGQVATTGLSFTVARAEVFGGVLLGDWSSLAVKPTFSTAPMPDSWASSQQSRTHTTHPPSSGWATTTTTPGWTTQEEE